MTGKGTTRGFFVLLLWGSLIAYLFWPLALGTAHLVPFHLLAGDPAIEGVDASADRPDWRTYDLAPITTFYAEKSLVAAELHRGELPLWNPYSGLGVPLLADGQSQPLAPFFLPFLAVPNPWVYSLCILAQLVFGGLGMDRFLRALGMGMAARTVGALLFAFSPFALKYMAFNDVWASAWFPWLFLCAERMAISGRGFWTMGGVVALAAASGHPEVVFLGAAGSWMYFLARAWILGGEGRRRVLSAWPLVPPIAALLLSAWWVFPFAEWVSLSTSERVHAFLPISYAWDAPFLQGSELLFPALLLALAMLGAKRTRACLAVLPALAWSVLLLFPVPQAVQTVLSLGFMSNRYGRSLAWFAVVALGAAGLDALAKVKLSLGEACTGLALFAAWSAGALAVAARARTFTGAASGKVPLEGAAVAASWAVWGLLAMGAFLWVAARWGSGARRPAISLGMAACLAGGILLAPPSTWAVWNRSAPRLAAPLTDPAPTPSGREWLPSMNGLQSLSPNLSAAFGMMDLRFVLPLTPRRVFALAQPLQWGFAGFYAPSDEVLAFCGVRRRWRVAPSESQPSVHLEARAMPVPIPRGFFVSEASAVPDAQTGLRRALDQSAWRTRVFLEGLSPAPPEAPLSAPATAAARVRLLEDRGNSSTWGVECPATGWFVLRDLYWPGWRADVDGRPAAILPADGVFRAVGIGRGEHTIAFRYRPASFGVGVLVSLAALCAFAVIGCRRLFGIAPGAHP